MLIPEFMVAMVLGTDMVGTQVNISDGAHAISHVSPVAQFGGYVYGTQDRESYSFQIGSRLASINQVLSGSVSEPANIPLT